MNFTSKIFHYFSPSRIRTVCLFFTLTVLITGGCVEIAHAQNYIPLAPLPSGHPDFDAPAPPAGTDADQYVRGILSLSVGVAAALAVLMIVFGGIQYMTSEAVGGKSEGKARIVAALQGLGLILFASLLLFTINPDIVSKPGLLPPVVIVEDAVNLQRQSPADVVHICVDRYGIQVVGAGDYPNRAACLADNCKAKALGFGRCVPKP